MAVALFGTPTVANSAGAAVASLACNVPTSTTTGHVMIAQVGTSVGTAAAINTPTGWTLISANNQSTNTGQYVFRRNASGSEPASYTFAIASGTSRLSIDIATYSGVDLNNPIAGFGVGTSGTASTSIAYPQVTPQAENVYAVLCMVTRNTTGAATVSAVSTGFTSSANTSTTATPFIQANIQDSHTVFGLPLANVAPAATTISQSSTRSTMVVLLRADISTATTITPDFFTGFVNAGSTTHTFSLSTGYAEVICISVETPSTSASGVSSISGASLTWAKAAESNVSNHQEIWWAYAASPITAQTITINLSASAPANLAIESFMNVSASLGTTATGTAITQAITTTANNSMIFWGQAMVTFATTTIATSNTKLQSANNNAGSVGNTVGRATSIVATSGTSFTAGIASPTGKAYDTVVVEVLAAVAPGATNSNFFGLF